MTSTEVEATKVRMSGRRLAVLTAVISVVAGLGSLVLFLAAGYGALSTDSSIVRQRVADGFRHRQLVENPYQEGSTTIGRPSVERLPDHRDRDG